MIRLKCCLMLLVSAGLLTACGSSMDLSRAPAQIDFGVKAAKMNLWREALFRFERAVQIDPANAMARNNLAVAYEGIGEFEKARSAYTEALRLDRSNQYIQKNYSRFVEFYSRNKKRERPLAGKEGEVAVPAKTDAAAGASTTPAPSPDSPPDPTPQADPRNEPPQVPVTTPPRPDKPNGASQ